MTGAKHAEADGSAQEPRDDFLREIVREDLAAGLAQVVTRFPPEPNGYLHIGHAYAFNLNFGIAAEFGGVCGLRFDDTNPVAEDAAYVEAMQEDIRWLGFDWGDRLFFASDYFEKLYAFAESMVERGLAYVDGASEDEIRERRGSFYEPGVDSPDRERPADENLDLLRRMRAGEFADGSYVLRAKIDMQSPDLNLRDPLMYRIRAVAHHRTGDAWKIYPMYDFAHGLSDSVEGVTHSLCSLEFADHRPLYEWFLAAARVEHEPKQREFGRRSLTYTVLSKRRLQQLVDEGHVAGWDDPRMPTLRAMRHRGYPPEAIRRFCNELGVTRRNSVDDVGLLEHAVRDQLNATAPRVMGVLRPLKLVITNYPEDRVDEVEAPYHPDDPGFGSRKLPLTRELWVEREDFLEDAPRKWHRLAPGREVRLRYACLVTCDGAVRDASGEITELRCRWDPDSLGGAPADGRKVRGTIHWVSAAHAVEAEVRLYDRLFQAENPMAGDGDFLESLNPSSLEIVNGCQVEPGLASARVGDRVQFERQGYFCVERSSTADRPVFNRTVGLRDTWAKQGAKPKR